MDMNVLLEDKRFVYDPFHFEGLGMKNYHFIVIGAGGTGGYLIPNLGRMVGIKNDEGFDHTVTIVDQDLIETKNLLRQNFSPNDVGKNKAEVMAGRYGRAFGENFYFLSEFIETAEQVKEIMESEWGKIPVLIDCVDNNKTRFIVKEGIRLFTEDEHNWSMNALMISSGNEEYSGQVVFSYDVGDLHADQYTYEMKSPDLIDIFPDMNIDQLPTEESCAEQAVSAPQNIHTNMTAADIIFGFVNRLLNQKEVDTLFYFFDSQTMMRTSFSGRNTHVKQLLQITPNNGMLNFYLPDEEEVEDPVFPPSYEDVLSHVVELDIELEEETDDVTNVSAEF